MKNKTIQIKWNMDLIRKIFAIMICVLAAVQLIMVFTSNLLRAEEIVNWDTSVMLRHEIDMWRNHTIFMKDFYNGSSLEIDTPTFLFLPIFFLTKSLGLAIATGFAVLYAVYMLVLRDIFGNLGKDKLAGVLATILIFTPYSIGELDWAKMLFVMGGQYSFRVLSLLLVIDAVLCWENSNTKKSVIVSACTVAVVFWTSLSCGNYVLLVALVPLLMWFVFKSVENGALNLNVGQAILLLCVCVFAVFGWKFHEAFAGSTTSSANNVLKAGEFVGNLQFSFLGLLMLFGGLTDEVLYPVFSLEGIFLIIRCIFPLLCIGLLIFNAVTKKKFTKLDTIFNCVAVVNVAVLIFTHTRYGAYYFEHRYHIIWVVAMFVCVAELLSEFKNSRYEIIFMVGLVILEVLLNVSGFSYLMQEPDVNEAVREVIEVSDEFDCNSVYWYEDRLYTRQLRALAPDKYSIFVEYDENCKSEKIVYMPYDYPDRSYADDRNMLMVSAENADRIQKLFPQYQLVKILESGWQAYVSDSNPWDGASGLPYGKITAVDFPYSEGYFGTGVICGDGSMILSGEARDIFYGPGTKALKGTYDIAIEYEDYGSEPEVASIIVTVDEEEMACENVVGNGGTFVVEDVMIPEGEQFNITVSAIQGEWTLKNIKYTRK